MAVRADERSLPGVILVWLLQVIGAVTAIIFGTFGVLSWRVADEANRLAADANDKSDRANSMSDVANLVALVFGAMRPDQFGRRCKSARDGKGKLGLTADGRQFSLSGLCSAVQIAAESTVSALASSMLGTILPTPTATVTTGLASSSSATATSISSSTATTATGTSVPTATSGASSWVGASAGRSNLGVDPKIAPVVGVPAFLIIVFISALTV